MAKRWKPADLVQTVRCETCERPLKLHGVPLGEPAFLLMTGHCHHCGGSTLTVRANDRIQYVPPPAVQLAGMFLDIATGNPSSTLN